VLVLVSVEFVESVTVSCSFVAHELLHRTKVNPAMTRRLAKVCRRQCQENFRILALGSAGSNQWRGPNTGSPSTFLITAPVPSLRFRSSASANNAVAFRGTWRVSPFYERGIVSTLRDPFTFSQVSEYISPKRILMQRQIKFGNVLRAGSLNVGKASDMPCPPHFQFAEGVPFPFLSSSSCWIRPRVGRNSTRKEFFTH
jgi:hypothetical protein